jgi:hypothetical protein
MRWYFAIPHVESGHILLFHYNNILAGTIPEWEVIHGLTTCDPDTLYQYLEKEYSDYLQKFNITSDDRDMSTILLEQCDGDGDLDTAFGSISLILARVYQQQPITLGDKMHELYEAWKEINSKRRQGRSI